MGHLALRGGPLLAAGIAVAVGGAAFAGGAILLEAPGHGARVPGLALSARGKAGASGPQGGGTDVFAATQVAPLRRIVPPDVLVVSAKGITPPQLTSMEKLSHVRDLITADGGAIGLDSRLTNVFGVDPGAFRSWTPPATAANEAIWSAVAKNRFVLSTGAQARLRLLHGSSYLMAGATQQHVIMGASAPLGIPGVDALVSRNLARPLGLVPNVAAMINAPGANVAVLMRQLRGVLGSQGQVIDLRSAYAPLPVGSAAGYRRPSTYLDLYRQSAAMYCPGLSWTVLAAIGQIESGHGANDGPSKDGALGPMQFLPSTWRTWGIPGFGDKVADIMSPYDAVPSAARYLCASGASAGGAALYRAVYAYNHADWYVRAVLALAQEYAQEYG